MVHDGEEDKRFRQLSLDYMSEESSPDESGSMRVHRPVWCSDSKYSVYPFHITDLHIGSKEHGLISHYTPELNKFLQELEKRFEGVQQDTKKHVAERKRRIDATPLNSVPPPASARWTVDKEWLKGNHSTTSILIKPPLIVPYPF